MICCIRKSVLFILKTTTLYTTVPFCILRNLGDIKSIIKHTPCSKQKCLQMVSIYTTLKNTGRKLKPDHLICCIMRINVFIEEAGFFSMNDSGEKRYKLAEQFFFKYPGFMFSADYMNLTCRFGLHSFLFVLFFSKIEESNGLYRQNQRSLLARLERESSWASRHSCH